MVIKLLKFYFLLLISVHQCESFYNKAIYENGLAKTCVPLERTLDLLFILDGSGSVKGTTFNTQKDMVRTVLNLVDVSPNKTRIAILQYSGYTKIEFPFDKYTTKDEIIDALHEITHISGTTKTGKALHKSLNMFEAEFGGRKGVHKVAQVVVVVSDGHSHDDPVPGADLLRADGVTVVAVGIGNHINMDELREITADPALAFRNDTMDQFVHTFKTIAVGEKCDFVKGTNGAETKCDSDYMEVEVETSLPLHGQLYVAGHMDDEACRAKAISNPKSVTLIIPLRKCGLNYQILLSPRGVLFSARVILQYHPVYHTNIDEQFQVSCFYSDTVLLDSNSHLAILQDIPLQLSPTLHSHLYDEKTVEMSDPDQYRFNIDGMRPPCVYTVNRRSAESCTLDTAAVAETVSHSWVCDNDVISGDYAMKIHSCFMEDVEKEVEIMVLDENGCSLDAMIMTEPYYQEDQPLRVMASGTLVQLAGHTIRYRCSISFCNRFDGSCNDLFVQVYQQSAHQCESDPNFNKKSRKKRQTEGMPLHMIKRLFARRRFLEFQHQQHTKLKSAETETYLQEISSTDEPPAALFPNDDVFVPNQPWLKAEATATPPLQVFTTPTPRQTKVRPIFNVVPINGNEELFATRPDLNQHEAERTELQNLEDNDYNEESRFKPITTFVIPKIAPSPWFEQERIYHPEAKIRQQPIDYYRQEEEENSTTATSQGTAKAIHSGQAFQESNWQEPTSTEKTNGTPLIVFNTKSLPIDYNDQSTDHIDADSYNVVYENYDLQEHAEVQHHPAKPVFVSPNNLAEQSINSVQDYSNQQTIPLANEVIGDTHENTIEDETSQSLQPQVLTDEEYEAAIALLNQKRGDVTDSADEESEDTVEVEQSIDDYPAIQQAKIQAFIVHPTTQKPVDYAVDRGNPPDNIDIRKSLEVNSKQTSAETHVQSSEITAAPGLSDMKLHGLSKQILQTLDLNSFIVESQVILVNDNLRSNRNVCTQK